MVQDGTSKGKHNSDKHGGVLETARGHVAAGISLVPVRRDGTKAAAVPWKEYQSRLPTDGELRRWFDRTAPYGIALIALIALVSRPPSGVPTPARPSGCCRCWSAASGRQRRGRKRSEKGAGRGPRFPPAGRRTVALLPR
jgi:hypothetical protein